MKKIKIKQKVKMHMTSVLMLAVLAVSLVGIIPKDNVYGAKQWTGSLVHSSSYKGSYDYSSTTTCTYDLKSDNSENIYLVEFEDSNSGIFRYWFCSYSSFTGTCTFEGDDGYKKTYSVTCNNETCGKYGPIYRSSPIYIDTSCSLPRLKYDLSELENLKSAGKLDSCNGENIELHLCAKVCNYEGRYKDDAETVVECGGGVPDGSQDNPIRDKSVGYPDIYDYKFLISSPSSGGESDKLYNSDYVKWKSKSTSGFKLVSPDSEFKNVYIQAKIVSRYQYNDSMWGNGDWHNYDNYGEVGWFNLIDASEKEFTVSFQQLTELLPKTHSEQHYFKKTNIDYDYYFRIVYTRADDLKVIPTYYSGGWRRVSCHSNNGKHDENGEGENSSAIIEDGDDDGGKWKKDDDSKDNGKNIDNGTASGSDIEDAKDNANNKDKDSSGGDLSVNIKSFMNQVGNVPKAIAKLFAFLPDWVTAFISFGFIVLVALMIIKAIRG